MPADPAAARPPVPGLPARPAAELLRGAAQGVAAEQPTLREVFAGGSAADGAATGFVLAHLPPQGARVLWVQDRLSAREAGRPYLPGLPGRPELLLLTVGRPADVLWAMEQGLCCAGLTAVVGEVWGEAAAMDFTATKRLALRAEAQGVAAWLLRRAARPDLSAARERWSLASLPSPADPDDPRSPGPALWRADLFRARWRAPGAWVAGIGAGTGRLQMRHGIAAEAAGGTPGALRATG